MYALCYSHALRLKTVCFLRYPNSTMWQSESGTETILVGQTLSLGPLQLLSAYLTLNIRHSVQRSHMQLRKRSWKRPIDKAI